MSARRSIARALRKWADLIDPRTGPSSDLTVRIDCDTRPIMRGLDDVVTQAKVAQAALRGLRSAGRRL